jgi:quercetin dioxygenase-like cupin family protein
MAVKDHVSVSKVGTNRDPAALERTGQGYLAWKNGALAALFYNGDPVRFIAFLEFKNGVVRGNHYHRKAVQTMLVLDGELKGKFFLPDAPDDVLELTLTQGDVVCCGTPVVHSFRAPEYAIAVEYSPDRYAVDDFIDVPVEW